MKIGKMGFFGIMILFGACSIAEAGDDAANAPRHKRHHGEMREVFQACAKANGVELPKSKTDGAPSAGDQSALHACVQRFHDDMRACLEQAGIQPPSPGERPVRDPSKKGAFEACRKTALAQVGK